MKISVIIPCKNESDTVGKLLDSLYSQKRQADEIIVVNSNSTDDTIGVAKKYSKKLPLKIIDSKERGVAWARNNGAKVATGDMLIFVDADSILPEKFLSVFEQQVAEKGFQAGSFTQRINSKKPFIRLGARFMNCYMKLMSHTPWPIGISCLYITNDLFKKIDGFDTELFIMEDYDLILQAKRQGARISIINTIYYASDRRFLNNPMQVLKGIYGELYRYTHGLRITKQIYKYEMGGKHKKR